MPSPRVAALRALPPAANPLNEGSFKYALISCLRPEEACEAFDATFQDSYSNRRTLLNKIIRDIERSLDTCHPALVDLLVSAFPHLPYKRQLSCANALIHLTEAAPKLGREGVLDLLLASKYVPLRRQAYGSLRRLPAETAQAKLPGAWDAWKDSECLSLIADQMPIEWLLHRLDDFPAEVNDGRLLSRLFVRLGQADPNHLERLFEVNPVSYAFAAAKLHYQVPEDRMREIFHGAWHEEHQSLVVWCIGQLGYWTLLMELYTDPGPPFTLPGWVLVAEGQ